MSVSSAPVLVDEPRRPMRLGEMLIERRQITQEDLDRALEIQRERSDKLGKILVDLGFIAMRDVLAALSEQLGVPLVGLDEAPPDAPEIQGISARFMRQCLFLPIAMDDASVTLAMADPLDFETISAVRGFCGLKVRTALAAEQEILDAIDRFYGESETQRFVWRFRRRRSGREPRATARHGQRGAGDPSRERHHRAGHREARQ